VLVVHRGPYDDPYDLDGEVQFVEVPADAQLIETVNAGFSAASGDIVHVLSAGMLAREGWADSVQERFDDPMIGAVSPVVLQADDEDTILSAGVRYTFGGRRLLNGFGKNVKRTRRVVRRRTIGPSLSAGFYRRSVIEALGGFCGAVGSRYSDVDVALSLKALGYHSVVEPGSVVVGDRFDDDLSESFRNGRCAERVFWRHAGVKGWLGPLAFHPFVVARSSLAGWRRPSTYASLLGRSIGMIQAFFCRGKDQARIEKAAQTLEDDSWSRPVVLFPEESPPESQTSAGDLKHPRRRAA